MSKHTPGPWIVDETVALGSYGVWTQDAIRYSAHGMQRSAQICAVHGDNSDFDRETTDANARLIAAAPDMLELLKRIAQDLPYAEPGLFVMDAQEILAKVEGNPNE